MAVKKIVEENLSHMLPTSAFNKRWTLFWEPPAGDTDPIILKDSRSRELYWWEYNPSLVEIFEVCRELEANYG